MAKASLKHFDWLDQMVEALQAGETVWIDGTKSMGDALRDALAFNRTSDTAWYSVKIVQTRLPRHEWTEGEQGGLVCFRYTLGKHEGDTVLRSAHARRLEAEGGEKLRRQVPQSAGQNMDRMKQFEEKTAQQKAWAREWGLPEEFYPAPVEHYTSQDAWADAMEISIKRFGREPFVIMCMKFQELGLTAAPEMVFHRQKAGGGTASWVDEYMRELGPTKRPEGLE